ncbi:aspartate--tRNA ligase [Buchnera aphidicola]|jgi:aspartyl-tRNA synthetase|uniref:Aspartate--tRNA ligase n=1 Tax=Buchnera aphidicola subsp. Schizaphis graminum (strain Sg) TaxID=198804 RepID=SYD_BUCAP|nr:aspartate--tRNA ligase [Buchnera aphidicola]P81432.1 RecName: Full=Aspartate--tRNA ligase; AltName: Full=Aspartyl-tRNA synthetase; Short=AspRS [Buchnera aphidicola str. Sg (Schizaphis graminum)]AAC05432.1 aspartyl-tRNA synthetase [Buchnera aphidicola]AAM67860.1 aspartyl-tRNA synthetase [Buchnera aphidicola str. Sg (Schizaphis graminum)]AWI49644.1 aspartate--tRNA ligase [Buchnera aphidicola (Schizaphis graminum)]
MRTKYCGNIRIIDLHKSVILCGWVHKIRNFSQFIFIDMRDWTGIVQLVFEKKNNKVFTKAVNLKNESCIQVIGIVKKRNANNNNLDTGEIEILVNKIKVFNISKNLPLDYSNNSNDDIRLKYRYLDLRRSELLENLKIRNKITHLIRIFMENKNFLDIETPFLTKSTPEGARDYLVPSRNYPGNFYALPQSPQLFKQILMISGIDKYYQIVKCFRDEDLRSDRQPEFTQIDIEASFVSSTKIRNLVETLIKKIWLKVINYNLNKFPKISFYDSMKRYGSDKPDLRNPMEIVDISDIVIEEKVASFFQINLKKKNRIALLCFGQGNKISQKKIDEYSNYVKKFGAKKLFYIKINKIENRFQDIQSSIKNILDKNTLENILRKTNAKNGNILFLLADEEKIVNKSLGMLRIKLGNDFIFFKKNTWKPVWIVDFPMFKQNSDGKFSSNHHPFTALKKNNQNKLEKNPNLAISDSYDLVINGYEIGGGSVRIHDAKIQKKVFNIIGIEKQFQREKFGFLIEALKYGPPPHAGIALGLDRIVMLLTNTNNIRDVIAFPKTTSANCLMTDSPSKLKKSILNELGINILKK